MTFTKEQLVKIIESADEVISCIAGTNDDVHPESDDMLRLWDYLNDVAAPPQVVKRLAEIALAALESRADAEPVAYMIGGHYLMHAKDPKVDNYTSAVPLYTRPQPAPVVVPDERSAFEAFMAKRFGDIVDQRRVKNGDQEYMAWDMAVAWVVWSGRAAMLQGKAEPLSQPYTLPEWIPCSERMPDDDDFVYIWP